MVIPEPFVECFLYWIPWHLCIKLTLDVWVYFWINSVSLISLFLSPYILHCLDYCSFIKVLKSDSVSPPPKKNPALILINFDCSVQSGAVLFCPVAATPWSHWVFEMWPVWIGMCYNFKIYSVLWRLTWIKGYEIK